eukprot:1160093-Pelagomonas_calceolata.AAC.3
MLLVPCKLWHTCLLSQSETKAVIKSALSTELRQEEANKNSKWPDKAGRGFFALADTTRFGAAEKQNAADEDP